MSGTPTPKYLPSSRRRKPIQDTRRDSYRHSLVWRWLNEGIKAGPDPVGQIVTILRKRIDMPRSFPTKTHMRAYLARCGFKAEAERSFERLWSLYYAWVEHQRHDGGAVE